MSVLGKLHRFNVIEHQVEHPPRAHIFHPWATKGLRVLHLTYQRGRHYNSVRSGADSGCGPAIKYPIDHPLMHKQAATAEAVSEVEEPKMTMAKYACHLLNIDVIEIMLVIMQWVLDVTYGDGEEIEVTEEMVSADIDKIK